MATRRRKLVSWGIAVVVCVIYGWLFGVQTLFAIEARYIAHKEPVVWKVPVELQDLSVSQTPGRKLSYFGYEFEVPWDDVDDAKSRITGGNKALIAFRAGNVLSVWNSSPRDFVNEIISSTKTDRDSFRNVYGDEALESDYAFQRMMLEASPGKVSPFVTRKQAVAQSMLLLMKSFAISQDGSTGIFEIAAGDFRGFQLGRPENARMVSVELHSDTSGLDFLFFQNPKTSRAVSQADVNRVLRTLHEAPAEPVAKLETSK